MNHAVYGMVKIAESAPRMSQQVRAAPGEPRRGEIPVELVSSQPFDDFPVLKGKTPGCRGQIGVYIAWLWEKEDICYMQKRIVKRGDIYQADLNPAIGSEQGGIRPVVVIQNNIGNQYSPTVIIAAITSKDKIKLPTHVALASVDTLKKDSVVLLEQLRTIDKIRLKEYVGTLEKDFMKSVDKALCVSLELKKVC